MFTASRLVDTGRACAPTRNHVMRIIKIKKKSGGFRKVYVQDQKRATVAKALAKRLTDQCVKLGEPGVIRGFMPGESPVTNAQAHASATHILQMDFKDFFDHCTGNRIYLGLIDCMVPKDWITGSTLASAQRDADIAVVDGAARQGLSSSPAAANIAAIPIDREIIAMLPSGVTYTRYADDLTFSSNNPELLKPLRKQVAAIAAVHGQEINPSKTRMQAACAGRMVVTGVAVSGGRLYPTKSIRRRLRAARHNAERLTRSMSALIDAGKPDAAALLWRLNRKQLARLRGLEEWAKLKPPKQRAP